MALWKPFLEITPQGDSVAAAFSFSRGTILVFKELEKPTGARGHRHFHRYDGCNAITSAFAAGKFGVRAFSQSLVKESGKENKHVAYVSLRLS